MAGDRSVNVGDTIGGRYLIEGTLGEGGMALVFRARHLGTGRACALKVIHPQLITRPQLIELFIREAQVGARIGQNPNIVDVFDAGADEPRRVPFLAMELLQGETLERYIETRGPMPPALASTLFEQLGGALDQAHRAGIVHRDLKPSNLFLTTGHKGEPLLKVVDFGIAKALEGEQSRTATQVGTPAYGAPEQFGASFRQLAERSGIIIAPNISPGTDVWAMGLIAYELLTGLQPGQYWGVDTLAELPLKVSIGSLDPPSARAGARAALLPPGFDAWFATCTRRNSVERWPSAGQAAAELGRVLGAAPSPPISAPQPSHVTPSYQPSQPALAQALTQPTPPPWTTPAPGAAGSYPKTEAVAMGALPGGAPPSPLGGYPAYGAAPVLGGAPVYGGPQVFGPPISIGNPAGVPQAPPIGSAGQARPSGGGRIAMFAGLALVVILPLTCVGVRRASVHAAVRACESEDTRCDEACDHEDLESCARLGRLAERGKGVAKDLGRAKTLYKRACDSKEPLGCALLATFVQRGRGGATPDPTEALRLAGVACDSKGEAGCVLQGEILRDAPGTVTRDGPRAAKLFQAACDAGEQRGCADLGAAYADGALGLTADEPKAAGLFQKSCDGAEVAGCAWLARFLSHGRGGLAKDPNRATSVLQKACDAGEDESCWVLATMTESGDGGITKDLPKALMTYQRLCDDGFGLACSSMGEMYAGGRAGPADDAKAGPLFRKACDLGTRIGCVNVGVFEELGRGGITKNVTDAVGLYRRGCEGGSPLGCVYLGQNLEAGDGVAKDEAQAALLYQRGCDGGVGAGCSYLAQMYATGRGGVAKDPARAVALFRTGCDDGNPLGCFALAYRYESGIDGLAKSDVSARGFYRQSCDSKFPRGCFSYGVFLDRGRGGPKDVTGAAEAFSLACDGKVAGGCAELASYYNEGTGVPVDKAKAQALFRRACEGGDTWACGKAGRPR